MATVSRVQDIETAARNLAAAEKICAIVGQLVGLLGKPLTAVVAGAEDSGIVKSWKRGTSLPSAQESARLREAYVAAQILSTSFSADVIHAWFMGVNPYLDNAAPAEMLAVDPGSVVKAAHSYVAADYD